MKRNQPNFIGHHAESTVLSVRMPLESLRVLTEVAREQGKGPATLACELIEQGEAMEEVIGAYLMSHNLQAALNGKRTQPWPKEKVGDDSVRCACEFCKKARSILNIL